MRTRTCVVFSSWHNYGEPKSRLSGMAHERPNVHRMHEDEQRISFVFFSDKQSHMRVVVPSIALMATTEQGGLVW